MTQSPPQTIRRQQRNWRRIAIDSLLLPPALLYVIIENVFWAGAKTLLRQAARLKFVAFLQNSLKRLPAAAILPLFLLPEALSHVGGFWATDLLVHRRWVAALLAGILVKGTATLIAVWIYQSCAESLLSVKWFAWLHGKIMQGRDWVAARTQPIRQWARNLLGAGRSGIARRFKTLRQYLARRVKTPRP